MKMSREANSRLYHFGFNSTREQAKEFALHCHSCYEIYYFVSGSVEYMVEGRRYRLAPGSLLLFAPGVVHGVRPEDCEEYCRYALHFYPECLPQEGRAVLLSSFSAVRAPLVNAPLRVYLDRILVENDSPEAVRGIMLQAGLTVLLGEIYRLCESEQPSLPADPQAERIIGYLNEHLTEPVCAGKAAAALYLSRSQVNRVFRRATGTTVGSYVRLKRAAFARGLMQDGVPATRAALEAGFEDYSTFYRACVRNFGSAPSSDEFLAEKVPSRRDGRRP